MKLDKMLLVVASFMTLAACSTDTAPNESDTSEEVVEEVAVNDTEDEVVEEEVEEKKDEDLTYEEKIEIIEAYGESILEEISPITRQIGEMHYMLYENTTDFYFVVLNEESKNRMLTAIEYLVEYGSSVDFGEEELARMRRIQIDLFDETIKQAAIEAAEYSDDTVVGIMNPINEDSLLVYAENGEMVQTLDDFVSMATREAIEMKY